jgi:hypothetical protein
MCRFIPALSVHEILTKFCPRNSDAFTKCQFRSR